MTTEFKLPLDPQKIRNTEYFREHIPEGYFAFVKRDMFNDSQFPHTLIPNTPDGLVSFLYNEAASYCPPGPKLDTKDTRKAARQNLQIVSYGPGSKFHQAQIWVVLLPGGWILGFLYHCDSKALGFPCTLRVTDGSPSFEGWETTVLQPLDPRDPESHAIHLWGKTSKES